MNNKKKLEKILWLDMEMTGLDVEKEVIIEVAAIVTDMDFNPLDTYEAVVKQPQHYLESMDEWCTRQHGGSGLTQQVPNGKEPQLVEEELCQLVDKHFNGTPAILAGNSIYSDRKFIDKYFLQLSERLHYRLLDVTSWKIIFENKFAQTYSKKDNHRALDDIKESIAELKFYIHSCR